MGNSLQTIILEIFDYQSCKNQIKFLDLVELGAHD